ncbi:hypothetical protein MNBD_CHLOROFLEXI01-4786 [hydrothermal vent metagenome]|uniref:Uncharacterized protein n=1 Tax=hydrothermal vent metagenome TaxID=652676 RepID=A0A3B0UVQ9_9ZZZZ
MQKIALIIIGLIGMIGIVSCQWQQTEKYTDTNPLVATPITPSSIATTPTLPDDFDFPKALRLLFSSPDMAFSNNLGIDTVAINTTVEWTGFSGINPCKPIPPPSQISENQYECTRILLAEPYLQREKDQIFMLTETINNECLACFPNLIFAVFQRQAEEWILVSKQSNFSSIGSWGQAPPAEFIQIGQNRFGILFHHNNTSSGITIGEIILISEIDGAFQLIFREQVALRYIEEGWGYDSEVAFIEDIEHDWYKIQIITIGTKPISTTQSDKEPFEEVKWLIWDGTSYKVDGSR